MTEKEFSTAVNRKCYICGKSTSDSLVIIDGPDKTRHVWCKLNELSNKT